MSEFLWQRGHYKFENNIHLSRIEFRPSSSSSWVRPPNQHINEGGGPESA